jgi:hypothetical protein
MLVCDRCGTVVEHCDLPYVTEMHGERHKNTVCTCGGEFIPARQCKLCGTWFDNTDLHGICEGCLSEEETVGNALELGSYSQEKVSINGFIAEVLTPKQINKILTKWVEENFVDHSKAVVDYLEGDMSAFAEFLEDKYGE